MINISIFIYIWLNLKKFDFLKNEMCTYSWTEEVGSTRMWVVVVVFWGQDCASSMADSCHLLLLPLLFRSRPPSYASLFARLELVFEKIIIIGCETMRFAL